MIEVTHLLCFDLGAPRRSLRYAPFLGRPTGTHEEFTMRKICAEHGCSAVAKGGKCQDCHKAFCAVHIGAHDFSGFRRDDVRQTSWTRFVCRGCAALSNRSLLAAAARGAHEQSRLDERGSRWDAR
jgi:hypothetical protein